MKHVFSILFVLGTFLTPDAVHADAIEGAATMPDAAPSAAPAHPEELALKTIRDRAARTLQTYKPVYFAYGNPTSKIQFSFRSQVSDAIPINFAYSQIIFWDLGADSMPFQDATYNPEFFYRLNLEAPKYQVLDFGFWEHNSNGKAGSVSRSYDQVYARYLFATGDGRWASIASVKVRAIYSYDDTNADIQNYMGPLELDFRFVQLLDAIVDEGELSLTLRPGGKFAQNWGFGGYQIAADFHIKGIRVNPAIYLQYFRGYGETLVNYNREVSEFRAGIKF